MKRTAYLLITTLILASCGGNKAAKSNKTAANSDSAKKAIPVTVQEVQPQDFVATINIQSQITGDQNIYASPQTMGIVKSVLVNPGQHVAKGQLLATLDAATIEQQIAAQQAQLDFAKIVYEKQKKLWAQNIGTEIQLLQAKANFESASKQKDALIAQRNMYRIIAPVSGTVDQVTLKVGDAAGPGNQGIRVVNTDKLKAEANLGENYLGKVHTGDPVTIVLPDINDSIKTKLSYVAQAVDPISRAFVVQVRLGNNSKLHPNMSCIMKIANYENSDALVVPISVIQKTSNGSMLYIENGNTAKAVYVKTGFNSNGQVEILSGLNAGDKVITAGFEDLDNGDPITIQQ